MLGLHTARPTGNKIDALTEPYRTYGKPGMFSVGVNDTQAQADIGFPLERWEPMWRWRLPMLRSTGITS